MNEHVLRTVIRLDEAVAFLAVESLSGCIPRSLLRASGLLPCCPNTPQLAAGIFYLST